MINFKWSLALLLATACGGAGEPAQDAETSSASRPTPTADLQALRVSVSAGLGDPSAAAVESKLESALLAAGFKLVGSNAPSDIQIGVTTLTEFRPSAFQMSFNGQPSGKNHVQVQVSLMSQGSLVDRASAEYDAARGSIDEAAVATVADSIIGSKRLNDFAVQLRTKQAAEDANRAAAEKQRADNVTAQREKVRAEAEARQAAADSEWDRIVGDCRAPKTRHSCDSLRAWIDKTAPNPDRRGMDSTVTYQDVQLQKKRDEAHKILQDAAPALQTLAEAEEWSHVDLDRCVAATTRDDCTGASLYVRRFPSGAHYEEANKALLAADAKLTAKEEQAQRQADAQQQAAAHQQQQANCKAGCSTTNCVMYTTDDKKAKCIAQCVQGCN